MHSSPINDLACTGWRPSNVTNARHVTAISHAPCISYLYPGSFPPGFQFSPISVLFFSFLFFVLFSFRQCGQDADPETCNVWIRVTISSRVEDTTRWSDPVMYPNSNACSHVRTTTPQKMLNYGEGNEIGPRWLKIGRQLQLQYPRTHQNDPKSQLSM